MSNEHQDPPRQYQVGDVINGYQWNGQAWQLVQAPRKRSSAWLWWTLGGLAALMTVLTVVVAAQEGPQRSSKPSTSASDDRKDAWFECKVAVLGLLKSPGSAEFPWYEPTFVAGASPSYLVNAYVDAQNSFGATVRTPFDCAITKTGSGWRVDNVVLKD